MAKLGPAHYSPYPVAIEGVLNPPEGKALLYNDIVDEEIAMREAALLYFQDHRFYLRGMKKQNKKLN